MNDRELLLAMQRQQATETQALDQVSHFQAQAVGLAAFCQTFLRTMLDLDAPLLVSRDEALDLLRTALRSR